ncbi:MAG: hypothetical protein GYA24_14730 [Candidatus Lokiarchaeota archaeon]|nr:hypothetical protein [Candidatus Lokiarchaeota archaeon]
MEYTTKDLQGFIHGLAWLGVEDHELTRFPTSAKPKLDPALWLMATMTSGVRIRFRARCDVILLDVSNLIPNTNPRMTQVAACGFDLYADGEYFDSFVPPLPGKGDFLGFLNVDGDREHDYEIHFPYVSTVTLNALALENRRSNEEPTIALHARPYSTPGRVVFYGSSITHGANADRPGLIYPALVARDLNVDFINLGFGGCGKGEPVVADLLASIPDVAAYVLDWGINLCSTPEVNLIHDRYHPLLEKLKNAHPDVPILLVNMQGSAGGKLDKMMPGNLEILRKEVRRVYDAEIATGNKKIWYLDGRDIFNGPGGFDFTIDRVHPHQGGFYKYAEKITPIVKEMLRIS